MLRNDRLNLGVVAYIYLMSRIVNLCIKNKQWYYYKRKVEKWTLINISKMAGYSGINEVV